MESQASGLMKEAERFLILSNIDRLWKEHLQALKFIQQAVSLRGYAQRDPLIEYKLEGYNLFLEMMGQLRRNVIYSIYQVCNRLFLNLHVCTRVEAGASECGLGFGLNVSTKLIRFKCCVYFWWCRQFQPVMVKKDEDQREKKNSGKGNGVTNGRANENLDAVGNVESSSTAASPQAQGSA